MLHKEIPFLRIIVPLCLGIIAGVSFNPGSKIGTFLLIAALVLFLASLFFNNRITNIIYGFAVSITFFTTGIVLYNFEKSRLSVLDEKESLLLCSVTDYPEEKANSLSITLKLKGEYLETGLVPLNGSLLAYHDKKDTTLKLIPGDIVVIKCTPVAITNKNNPGEFDYRFWLENQGIKYLAYTKAPDFIKKAQPLKRSFRNNAYMVRRQIIGMFEKRGIRGERLALVAAITLGHKSLLDPETKLNFSKAGAMHVMAVSGMNAGILSLFIFNMLFFLKGRLAPIKSLITILVIWFFAFITGLTPSVERATLMFSFIQAGKLLGRQPNPINSVLASAFVMLIIRPSVLFDTGFQLSYVAVLFIIGFYENFKSVICFRRKIPEVFWEAIIVTLIAQAGTLALTIMSFNRFPVYFLLTNLIVVPVSSLMIILAFLMIITFPVPFLSQLIADILNFTTFLTGESTRIISSFNHSSIDNIGMSPLECILLTIFIALVLSWLISKEKKPLFIPLIFLLFFILTGTISTVQTERSNELIVYNTSGSTTIGLRRGKVLNLYRYDFIIPPEVIRHSAVKGLTIRSDTLRDGYTIIDSGSTRIIITGSVNGNETFLQDSDLLILTGKRPQLYQGAFEKNFFWGYCCNIRSKWNY